jgi:hypothetical protein
MSTTTRAVLVLLALISAAFPRYGIAQCASQQYPTNSAGAILISTYDPHITNAVISAGVAKWQSCAQSGGGFPSLITSGWADMTFRVELVGGISKSQTGGCGQFAPDLNPSTHQVIGGKVQLFDASLNGVDCEPYRDETIAHEIGHGLGLAESTCPGYMMGPPGAPGSRSAQSDECATADANWTTPAEAPPSTGGGSGSGDLDPAGCPYSPIIINFGGGGYRLTGSNAPVSFDMSGDGHPVLMGWTAAGTDEAFLWLDRNHNGVVTSGAELFGNFTPLQSGQLARNGFEALAEYDSNRDGVIDSRDPIWPQLLLWRDLNHNGVSEPAENSRLDASGVAAIDLHPHWTGSRDPWGNLFRYESLISVSNEAGHGVRKEPVYDIFFVPVSK